MSLLLNTKMEQIRNAMSAKGYIWFDSNKDYDVMLEKCYKWINSEKR